MTIIDLGELVSAMRRPGLLSTDGLIANAEVLLMLPEGASVTYDSERNTVVVLWGAPKRYHYGDDTDEAAS